MNTIPVIDIAPLRQPDRAAWTPVIEQIDRACRQIGFLAITGHGISARQLEQMFALSQRFFDQPLEEKLKIELVNSGNHRGWGSHGAEQLDPKKPMDWKETFDMALDLHPEHPVVAECPALYGPNQYPELAGFQQQVNQHYGLLMSVGQRMLKAMALALGEAEDFFTRHFAGEHVSVLRLIHYPPRPDGAAVPEDAMAAGAHTDYGCITLLAQDEVGGLEVQGRDGSWISVPPVEGALVVNIGDLMQRWTNDRYRSTSHRGAQPGAGSASLLHALLCGAPLRYPGGNPCRLCGCPASATVCAHHQWRLDPLPLCRHLRLPAAGQRLRQAG